MSDEFDSSVFYRFIINSPASFGLLGFGVTVKTESFTALNSLDLAASLFSMILDAGSMR